MLRYAVGIGTSSRLYFVDAFSENSERRLALALPGHAVIMNLRFEEQFVLSRMSDSQRQKPVTGNPDWSATPNVIAPLAWPRSAVPLPRSWFSVRGVGGALLLPTPLSRSRDNPLAGFNETARFTRPRRASRSETEEVATRRPPSPERSGDTEDSQRTEPPSGP